ncbi:MAG: family N-acetyltransferase [Herminiimonas sp.]|nr:family N-acetyltransferase [Herminiimonas sp.]
MKSNKVFDNMFNVSTPHGTDAEPVHGTAIRIKELSERDRRRILMHFLSLDNEDRLLRFGSQLPDELVTRYVQRLDFGRDAVFGVHDDSFRLIGVGHLGFAPRTEVPALADVTTKEKIAELGVSVLPAARGLGVGTRLFERAAIHCRNADVDTLMMHCLASNQAMIHIARKAGMQIQRAYGEADAYLSLSPASPGSMLREAVQEQVATLDYAYKANNRAAVKLLRRIGVNKSDSSKK